MSRTTPLTLRLTLLLTGAVSANTHAGIMTEWAEKFAASDIVFSRSDSNVPFLPLAFASARHYQDSDVTLDDGRTLSFSQQAISQGAVVPFLMSNRDALLLGEWISWSKLSPESEHYNDLQVLSVGLPVGWLHQRSKDWQTGGFLMPLGHKADSNDAQWSWELMGGGFARYTQTDKLWWAYGLYFDVSDHSSLVLPYLGASYQFNERWTLSAIMPWPAVMYAPSDDWLFRFGLAPAGNSWQLNTDGDQFNYVMDNWDLGLSVEKRVHRHFWLELEAGVGGLKGLSVDVNSGDWEAPDFAMSSSGYINIGFNFRPSLGN
ncbi:hypothetical protein [Gilvimarinus chinensis]|uniref:hypothetical protein n=1 Tax=Gilvimarinus chinensis TaxID=396005 RepID=UPI0003A68544|nr:hypothetical protein [Gilvimarinus chinensis]